MFVDESQDVVVILSDTKTDKYVRDEACQTRPIGDDTQATQATLSRHAEVQTDFIDSVLTKKTKMKIDNSRALSNFLLRVYPDMAEQLVANARSHAFDGYDVNWNEEESEAVECLFTLNHDNLNQDHYLTSLSWNSTGSTIAAAYGSHDHPSWCIHKSSVTLWNIDSSKVEKNKAEKVVDVSSCVMDISFHHTNPALLAGGDFSGQVYVWDMSSEEDPLVATSSHEINGHQDPVAKVVWIKEDADTSSSLRKDTLVSISGDGKILVWEFNKRSKELKLTSGFMLIASKKPRDEFGKIESNSSMGISCVSFSNTDRSTFIVGSESGAVFKCSLTSTEPLPKTNKSAHAASHSSVEWRSPVTVAYDPHISPVVAIQLSPHHRNLFLTAAMDMSVRVYSLLQLAPLLTTEPGSGSILDACWSPSSACLLMLTTSTGFLLCYDLRTSLSVPMKSVEAAVQMGHTQNNKQQPRSKLFAQHQQQVRDRAVHALRFHPKRFQVLASGDGARNVRVWNLSSDLVGNRTDDLAVLERMTNDENKEE